MNDHSSKKILFSKSSLLNLKAELMKKQEEVLEKKRLPQHKIEHFKPPRPTKSNDDKNENVTKKSFIDSLKAIDVEELEACRKSKSALEKKAELYEHLADNAGNSQLAGRFLVDFKTKKDEEAKESLKNDEDNDDDVVETTDYNDADEWTEFTDCLGRTRKCLKIDIDMFKERDKRLMQLMFPEKAEQQDEEPEPQKEKPFLVQKTNDYLHSLREKWEEKERELLAKKDDIHYQDVLFDEARMHGVSYYSFSTDETERRKQIQELLNQRSLTAEAQRLAEEKRKKREEVLSARVKAAKARQRMRAGLPPEDPEETASEFASHLLEFLTQQRNAADAKAKEEEKKRKEEEEKERQKLREAYVREWDLGKDGVEDRVKKFRELTQEEYVEQQRGKRIDEFAPINKPSSSKSNLMFDERGKMVEKESDFEKSRDFGKNVEKKTWSEVRPKAKTPPPEIGNLNEQKGLYFSTKQNVSDSKVDDKDYVTNIKKMKYRNFVPPTPIVNEVGDFEAGIEEGLRDLGGTEVAPPPTYDYYGPVSKRQRFAKPFESDLREAYEQGEKNLEPKTSCRQISKDYDFIM